MKGLTGLFLGLAGFFLVTGAIYAATSVEPSGTALLVFSLFMCALVAFYLGFTARRIRLRADEQRPSMEESAGVVGFFSPFSYWPVTIAVGAGLFLLGLVVTLWLSLIGGFVLVVSIVGLVFQQEPTDARRTQRRIGTETTGFTPAGPGVPGPEPAGAERRRSEAGEGGRS